MSIVRVTDHAVVRYLERARGLDLKGWQARGVDVEALRVQISEVCELGAATGATAVLVDGVRLVLRRNSRTTFVVTALDSRWSPVRAGVVPGAGR